MLKIVEVVMIMVCVVGRKAVRLVRESVEGREERGHRRGQEGGQEGRLGGRREEGRD